ncbi:MAG: hypothetical protein Q7S35_13825 [Candidatus Limnocylindrales bacterium]|nr:hypothetical protein [Candidatus Limnocylindrales bacterium]
MLVNRRFLYLGVFLVAIGGVLVVADLVGVDATTLRDTLQLWPLAIIAIGLGLALRRTRFSLPGGMLAAAVPGLLLGGGFALVPRLVADCGAGGAPSTVTTEQGVFDGPARVSVATGCGSLVVSTAPGSGWRLEGGDAEGRAPIVDASARSLSIDAGGRGRWYRFDTDRDTWRLTLPTSAIEDLSLVVNAGSTTVDLSEASVASLSGTVNAGMLSFRLAPADVVGSLEVNAGALEVCVPGEVGLRVRHDGALSGISINGLHQTGTDWQSPNYASATHHADLNIDVNLGSVEINPNGGCK